ncbi:YqgQ family protein [Hazenella coriacea]|uniref:Uncharacterized protein YqgQ n=1 Tax=Hazenella coriacea TaxID=1179467 RepID=A0A4R3L6P3_9BACL|nr:YqgQ family protein [Hazenella coriacea]TCS95092.1 uncharacterized protein YqgQ [Hazenella coriacea]
MNRVKNVRDLLKRFGIVVYTGDPVGDLEFMLDEIKDLKDTGLIENEEYLKAITILKKSLSR